MGKKDPQRKSVWRGISVKMESRPLSIQSLDSSRTSISWEQHSKPMEPVQEDVQKADNQQYYHAAPIQPIMSTTPVQVNPSLESSSASSPLQSASTNPSIADSCTSDTSNSRKKRDKENARKERLANLGSLTKTYEGTEKEKKRREEKQKLKEERKAAKELQKQEKEAAKKQKREEAIRKEIDNRKAKEQERLRKEEEKKVTKRSRTKSLFFSTKRVSSSVDLQSMHRNSIESTNTEGKNLFHWHTITFNWSLYFPPYLITVEKLSMDQPSSFISYSRQSVTSLATSNLSMCNMKDGRRQENETIEPYLPSLPSSLQPRPLTQRSPVMDQVLPNDNPTYQIDPLPEPSCLDYMPCTAVASSPLGSALLSDPAYHRLPHVLGQYEQRGHVEPDSRTDTAMLVQSSKLPQSIDDTPRVPSPMSVSIDKMENNMSFILNSLQMDSDSDAHDRSDSELYGNISDTSIDHPINQEHRMLDQQLMALELVTHGVHSLPPPPMGPLPALPVEAPSSSSLPSIQPRNLSNRVSITSKLSRASSLLSTSTYDTVPGPEVYAHSTKSTVSSDLPITSNQQESGVTVQDNVSKGSSKSQLYLPEEENMYVNIKKGNSPANSLLSATVTMPSSSSSMFVSDDGISTCSFESTEVPDPFIEATTASALPPSSHLSDRGMTDGGQMDAPISSDVRPLLSRRQSSLPTQPDISMAPEHIVAPPPLPGDMSSTISEQVAKALNVKSIGENASAHQVKIGSAILQETILQTPVTTSMTAIIERNPAPSTWDAPSFIGATCDDPLHSCGSVPAAELLAPLPRESSSANRIAANYLGPRDQEHEDQPIRQGIRFLFDNRFAKAKTLFQSKADSEPLFSYGLASMQFLKAMMVKRFQIVGVIDLSFFCPHLTLDLQ
ncbi:hypothetical protein DM01DRAFT_1215266 [Hesseltinella vesiculosa]|uniref:Uncharacterized protein n=1 Tax=Hesseltinella vesiculosa TaxID=101127 RepID=A0A1X2G257_9FUNG|nr:hypothetical protein DM01DRAFT_1215266 [Hesseltinella vesiculosa]